MASLRWVVLAGALVSWTALGQGGGGVFVDVTGGATVGYSRILDVQRPVYGLSIRSGTTFLHSYTSGTSLIFGIDLHWPSPNLFGAGLGYTVFPFGDAFMIRASAMVFGFSSISYELALGPELELQWVPEEWPIGLVVRGGGLMGIVGSDALMGRGTIGIVWRQG